MKKTVKIIARQLFAFLASLQLAVVLLVSLAIILSVGTFYESLYDAETAKYYVYGTWWFLFFLLLLGVNVLCAALSRFPWKRHHTGFVVVHLGIILILIGSLISLLKGYEGQLVLAEGETRERLILKDNQFYFYDLATAQLEEVPANFRFDPPEADRPLSTQVLGGVLVKVDQYLHHAQPEEEITEGQGLENPALHVKIDGSRAKLQEWVFSRDYSRQRLALGPAAITYLEVPSPDNLPDILRRKELRGPVLYADGGMFPMTGNMGREIPLGAKTLFLENYLPHAAVTQGVLVNLSPRPENPVAKLTIRSEQGEEQHTVFAKFPDLATFHQKVLNGDTRLRLLWVPEDLGTQENEMVLSQLEGGELVYSIFKEGKWSPLRKIQGEEKIATGWMDFDFSIAERFQKAQVVKKFRRVPVAKGKEGPPPAVHLVLADSGHSMEFWLGRGESKDVALGERRIKVAYALKSVPLGFQVRLNKFHMGQYEGTNDPSEYESHVTLIDSQEGLREDHLIAMNQPLSYGKYKTFQASYQLNPDGPDWSVLSVAYDPGIPLKYGGSIVLVTGIILIFFFRPVFLRNKVRQPSYSAPAGAYLNGEVYRG